jgi:hypothetical protein
MGRRGAKLDGIYCSSSPAFVYCISSEKLESSNRLSVLTNNYFSYHQNGNASTPKQIFEVDYNTGCGYEIHHAQCKQVAGYAQGTNVSTKITNGA